MLAHTGQSGNFHEERVFAQLGRKHFTMSLIQISLKLLQERTLKEKHEFHMKDDACSSVN